MDLPVWADVLIAVAAVLVAAGTIWRYVLPVLQATVRLVRGTAGLVEDFRLTGGFAGIGERLDRVEELAKSSHRELHPNGGSSMRDTVNATAAGVEAIADKAERLEGYAAANRAGIARLDTRVTDLDEKVEHQGERITEHRRRNEETVDRLQAYLEGERHDLIARAQGLEASVHELLMVDGHEERPRPAPAPEPPDHQPDL